ncbi:GNAT domain-domain-containing protein [Coniella lustricola]|uniref:GNAT domain-domain-containing protein n=1 Tax=Coniella lustricola TaxID=2025994 RepID=A0A2T3AEJ6_9PEZI|nr:GNAT domain-domain-containing protein [Coniella lustricola]
MGKAAEAWTPVQTTLPRLPASSARSHITTRRLLIRPIAASDLEALHELRTQPEVMMWTSAGRIDIDKDETASKLAPFLPPHDAEAFNCTMCLRETGEIVGMGGVHRMNTDENYGWPEIGYMFKKEHWGKGLATEFVDAFLREWDALDRVPTELKVKGKTLAAHESSWAIVKEQLVAVADATNTASQRILVKCGFEQFDVFEEQDSVDPTKAVQLLVFRYFPHARESKIE